MASSSTLSSAITVWPYPLSVIFNSYHSLVIWGTITTAVTARIRLYEPWVTYVSRQIPRSYLEITWVLQHDALIIYACCLGIQGMFYLIGGYLERTYDARSIALVGIGVFLLGIGGCVFASTLFEYVLYAGVLCGAGYGLAFISSLSICIRWFPSRSGSITGIVIMGLGIGQLIFSQLGTPITPPNSHVELFALADSVLNPKHLNIEQGEYVNSEIAQNVPKLFSTLFISYVILAFTGHLLLIPPHELQQPRCICSKTQPISNQPLKLAFSLKEPLVWHIITCFTTTATGSTNYRLLVFRL